ncbi:MAG: fumarylacetoacetate hydrolase family protein, partial [Sphingomonas sp.]
MKLLRYGPQGLEKPGLLDASGQIRDLSGHIRDLTPEHLSPAGLAKLKAIDASALPIVASPVRLGVPVAGVRKFPAIGLNFADHAAEAGLAAPSEPIIFHKAVSCLSGPHDEVMLPRDAVKADWEVVLGVVIGRTARYVDQDKALDYVAGYVVVN